MRYFLSILLLSFLAMPVWSHHNSPEDMIDTITETLLLVDSPHATTSEDDPSLLDAVTIDLLTTLGMVDIDEIVIVPDISITEVLTVVEETLAAAAINNSVCDSAWMIAMQDDGLYTVSIYIDYCDI